MFAKRLILAVAASLMAVFAVSTAAVAADGETRTLTNNAYTESNNTICDPSQPICQLTFPPTTHTTTLIKAVSCFVSVTPGSFVSMDLVSAGAPDDWSLPTYISSGAGDNIIYVSTNASTYMYLNKGAAPFINAQVSGGSFYTVLRCTIAGEHS